jgi:RNA polymerase sigma-70 factor (ECF subfamily)
MLAATGIKRSMVPVSGSPLAEFFQTVRRASPLNDEALIRRVVAADKQAFEALLDHYLGDIVSFARRFVGHHEADDIAQEVFARVWQKAGQWQRGKGTVRAWLYRITYNLCMDVLKKHKPESGLESNDVSDQAGMQPDRHAENADLKASIDAAMQGLPERQRSAISLCLVHGLGNREAAAVLGVSVEALESLLSRGRRQLRQVLDGARSGE